MTMANEFKYHLFPKEDHFILVLILFGLLVSSNFNPADASEENEAESIPIIVSKTFFIDKIFEDYGRNQSPSDMTYTQFDTLYKRFLSLNNETINTAVPDQGEEKTEENHEDSNDHHDHGHHKRKKRGVDSHKDHMIIESPPASLCFDADDLFEIFDLNINDTINTSTFEDLCPAFIEQAAGKYCAFNHATTLTSHSRAELWVFSFLAVTLINMLSGFCAVFFPRQNNRWYPYIHMFIISMGISVMVCDALLHLFPHAVGLHFRRGESGSALIKSAICLIGLFIFILVEMALVAFHDRYHSHPHPDEDLQRGTFTSHIRMQSESSLRMKRRNTLSAGANTNRGSFKEGWMDLNRLPSVDGPSRINKDSTKKKNSFLINFSSVKGVVWCIEIGDMVHNLVDGIVLGVSFTDSHSKHGGVRAAVSILLHELPHEVCDFDFVLRHGLSVQQAIFLNFISALFAYIGMIIGVSLNMYVANSIPWTFGVSSGLFIYISLIVMLPELKSNSIIKTNPTKAILLDVVGLLVGAVIVVFLSGIDGSVGEQLN